MALSPTGNQVVDTFGPAKFGHAAQQPLRNMDTYIMASVASERGSNPSASGSKRNSDELKTNAPHATVGRRSPNRSAAYADGKIAASMEKFETPTEVNADFIVFTMKGGL